MENNIRFLEICWAAQRSGLYYTCISSRLTAGEVEYIVRDCGAKVLIASHSLAKIAGELVPPLTDVKLLMVGGTIPGFESYEDAAAAMPQTRIADETAGLDMLYSSGTTGRPKGVRHALSGLPIDAPSPLLATCRDAVRPQRGHDLSLARAALSRGAPALLHDDAPPRRHGRRDGAFRRRSRRWDSSRNTKRAAANGCRPCSCAC